MMVIPTTLQIASSDHNVDSVPPSQLRDMGYKVTVVDITSDPALKPNDPLLAGLAEALRGFFPPFWQACDASPASVLHNLRPAYSVYHPMLLLNATMGEHKGFALLLSTLSAFPTLRTTFLTTLASSMGVTHIALNAPIPSHLPSTGITAPSPSLEPTPEPMPKTNTIRSPTNLTPIHGDFGPALPQPPTHTPTPHDYTRALWVTITQNGIHQTWAPRYTMFSRGNITEKARLLHLPSVASAIEAGRLSGKGCAAVDLFAGIGYFAFSFLRAGVGVCMAWDLNAWSCEGLRRGAVANGWRTRTVVDGTAPTTRQNVDHSDREATDRPDTSPSSSEPNTPPRLLIHNESNTHAASRISALRTHNQIPPIRHVNAGMLPSAALAWETAVRVLDPDFGGWLHLHEVVRADLVGGRCEEIRGVVEGVARGVRGERDGGGTKGVGERESGKWRVEIEHVERVKSVGPRMVHVVVDLWVPP